MGLPCNFSLLCDCAIWLLASGGNTAVQQSCVLDGQLSAGRAGTRLCACRTEAHACISRTPHTPRLQVECHASSNASNTKSHVGGKAKATVLPCIEYQPERSDSPDPVFGSQLASAKLPEQLRQTLKGAPRSIQANTSSIGLPRCCSMTSFVFLGFIGGTLMCTISFCVSVQGNLLYPK